MLIRTATPLLTHVTPPLPYTHTRTYFSGHINALTYTRSARDQPAMAPRASPPVTAVVHGKTTAGTALTAGPCTAQQRPQPALTDRLRPASIPTDTDGYARRPLPLAPHAPHTIPRPHAPYTISRSCTRAYRIPSRALDSPFRPYPSPASPCHRRCNDRLQP